MAIGIADLTRKVLGFSIELVGTSLNGEIKMALVGAFAAKTHLANLLDRVSRGEKITITRHGVPAAMLVPVEETRARMTHKEIVEGMRQLRKRIKPGKMSVRQMVEEGRRF
jgi:prevent-host-death family protein